MSSLPSIPGWDGIHPVMVQLTIGMFCTAPVLLIASLFARRAWQTWATATLLVLLLGTVASWLAVASGHAAGQLVDKSAYLQREISNHEALGMRTRTLFTLLTTAFALLVFLPKVLRRALRGPMRVALYASFLVVGLAASLVMARAASQGGRLVHELGVRAMVVQAQAPSADVNAPVPTPRPEAPGAPPPAARVESK